MTALTVHTVHTARLAIEPLRVADAPLLFALLTDPQMYVYAPDTSRASVEALAERFQVLELGPQDGSGEVWLNWVLRRLSDGLPIGTLQATVVEGSHAWLGYSLTASAWGQGYATEACLWLMGELPPRYRLREILASVDVRNGKSIALLERLGFECTGTEPAEINGEASTDHQFRLACAHGL